MSAAEKILIAEETVAGLQSQLKTVEAVLETAEQVAVTGEKAGRCLKRFFRLLLFLTVVAALAMVIKKAMGDRCSTGEERAPESEAVTDTDTPAGDLPAGDDDAPVGDEDAS